jgi:hypothetical protein
MLTSTALLKNKLKKIRLTRAIRIILLYGDYLAFQQSVLCRDAVCMNADWINNEKLNKMYR